MKDLEQIISALSKDEIRFYKLFVNRTNSNKNKSRKDVELFDFIRKGKTEDLSTKKILNKLSISNSNNYYQLKNRIYNDLNNSMTWQHISKDKQSLSFSYILLSRVFKNKGELDLSFNYLLKAEKIALKDDLFEILSIIYTEIIELSHELISIDIDRFISLKNHNINILREIDQIDMLLAKIMYDIKTKQNFSLSDVSITNLIEEKIIDTRQNKILINSRRFKLRLFKMYSRILLQKQDFKTLEKFLLSSYTDFIKDKFFERNNHDEKLTLLTYLVNCLYENKKYKSSLKYVKDLRRSMKEYDGFLEEKYMFYYYNALVLNYGKTDKSKSLETLKEASKNELINKMPAYTSFIYLNTALIYFQTSRYSLAQKNISRLILQHDFVNLDKIFQLQIYIFELILKIELGQNKIALQKINNLKKNFAKTLKLKKYNKENQFISILFNKSNDKNDMSKILSFINNYKLLKSNRNTVIDYVGWLQKLIK
ncbi:hypothetical protein OA521_02270 [bacterium]|nr:hypothetical protein [bacterium]